VPYYQAVKYGVIFAAVVLWNISVYRFGYNERDQLATIVDLKQQIETAALNKQVSEEQAKNSAYALFIESEYNDKVNEINKLSGDFHSALSVPTKRKICADRLPKAGNTTSFIEVDDYTELSTEFKEFLISESYRAEIAKQQAESRYDFLLNLCNTGQAVCQKEGK